MNLQIGKCSLLPLSNVKCLSKRKECKMIAELIAVSTNTRKNLYICCCDPNIATCLNSVSSLCTQNVRNTEPVHDLLIVSINSNNKIKVKKCFSIELTSSEKEIDLRKISRKFNSQDCSILCELGCQKPIRVLITQHKRVLGRMMIKRIKWITSGELNPSLLNLILDS